MTRRRIACEGQRTLDGRLIEPGALGWRDRLPILLLEPGQSLAHVVGQAQDVRREDDGWITAEVIFHTPGRVDESNLALAPTIEPSQTRPSDDFRTLVFTQGFIAMLFVVEPAARPWPQAGLEVPA